MKINPGIAIYGECFTNLIADLIGRDDEYLFIKKVSTAKID
jgi:hypothetical protein